MSSNYQWFDPDDPQYHQLPRKLWITAGCLFTSLAIVFAIQTYRYSQRTKDWRSTQKQFFILSSMYATLRAGLFFFLAARPFTNDWKTGTFSTAFCLYEADIVLFLGLLLLHITFGTEAANEAYCRTSTDEEKSLFSSRRFFSRFIAVCYILQLIIVTVICSHDDEIVAGTYNSLPALRAEFYIIAMICIGLPASFLLWSYMTYRRVSQESISVDLQYLKKSQWLFRVNCLWSFFCLAKGGFYVYGAVTATDSRELYSWPAASALPGAVVFELLPFALSVLTTRKISPSLRYQLLLLDSSYQTRFTYSRLLFSLFTFGVVIGTVVVVALAIT